MPQAKDSPFAKAKASRKPFIKGPLFQAVRCLVALVFVFTTYWLLNYSVFPLFDTVSVWAREVSAIAGGITLIIIALVVYWQPQIFRRSLFWGIPAIFSLGLVSMLAGLYLSSPAALFVGSSLVTIGISMVAVIAGLACTALEIRTLGICIALAYACSYALRFLFPVLTSEFNLLIFVSIPFITFGLCASTAKSLLKKILSAESPAQTAVTSPDSLIPFAHQVFITLVIFRIIYGYSLTFAESDRVPFLPILVLVPLVLYGVFLVIRKSPLDPDVLFRASILFIVAGFLIPSIAGIQSELLISTLLNTGTGLFEILMVFVLVSLGAKNNINALLVLVWGNAMASLGTVIGANIGRLSNQNYFVDNGVVSIISACIVFGLVVYILSTFHNFSFSGTISKVEAASPVHPGEPTPDFDQRCIELGEQAGLTARESEIFLLLAQGRNARFIQEKLVVSYNTVKTHVSHIYAKLGVHTHQELIDLVEES